MSDSVGPAGAPRASAHTTSFDRTQRDGVAIIGMSCLFPMAKDVDAFWSNILGKVNAVTDPPPEAWDATTYFDPDELATDRTYCKKGGYLADLMEFEPLAYGIPPTTVGGEPDQWLALKAAREALTDAGYEDLDEQTRQRTALILGRGGTFNTGMAIGVQHGLIVSQTLDIIKSLQPDLTDEQMQQLRTGLKQGLPDMGPDLVPGLVPNVIVGRIANRLDLMGPSFTVDAACASSLIAVEQAVGDLLSGNSDLVICGGSQVWTPMPILTLFCQVGALSRRQEIRPFDKDADGTILGEGLGMVVLKRLADAKRDGDRVYAVIKGVGVSSDGRAMGLLTPRLEGEELAIRRAYESAGVSPQTVELIEAHGTGTPVGDLTEITALTRIFGTRQGDFPSIAVGSVKSMISHTLPAAGSAGIIKTALALHHKVLPPTLNVTEPNPRLELEKTPFYINTEPRPWIHEGSEPRRAGVSSFGFGGVNAHVVLEEYLPPAESASDAPAGGHGSAKLGHLPAWDSEVCVLSAPSREDLAQHVASLQRYLADAPAARLSDVAYTLALELNRRPDAAHRLAIVATSTADLADKLQRAAEKLADATVAQVQERAGIYYTSQPLAKEGKLAFLYSGEGSQYHNMLADLCLHFPEVRACFDRLDTEYRRHGFTHLPSEYIFPRTSFSATETAWAEEQLWSMDGAVAAVVAADEAMHTILDGLGVRPDVTMGHSAGEWQALRSAGVFGRSKAEKDAWIGQELMTIGQQMQEARDVPPITLLSIGGSREQVETLIQPLQAEARIALDNCPHQVVVAVAPERADSLREAAANEGLIVERLNFDRPFHTPLYSAFSNRLTAALDKITPLEPEVPVYSCATAAPFPADAAGLRRLISDQWISPVQFRRTVETLHDEGVRVFLEVGARGNLTAFVEDILRKRPFTAIPANLQTRSGIAQVNHMAGRLAAQGVALDLTYLFKYREVTELDWADTAEKVLPANVQLNVGFPAMRLSEDLAREIGASAHAANGNGHLAPSPVAAMTVAPALAAAASATTAPAAPSMTQAAAVLPPVVPALAQNTGSAHAFFSTMERFLDVERSVMGRYLRGEPPANGFSMPALPVVPPAPPPTFFSPVSSPAAVPAPAPSMSPSAPPPAPPPSAVEMPPAAALPDVAPAAAAGVDVAAELLAIAAERTGYPAEAISLDADLEADLGIDSIKRVEIFGTLLQRLAVTTALEDLTSKRNLREVIELLAPAGNATPPSIAHAAAPPLVYPMLQEVVSYTPDQELVINSTYDAEGADYYLQHHTIGRRTSVYDTAHSGLPMMPLAMSLEILAEAACTLVPGKVVSAFEDIRATRWMAFDGGPQTIEIKARRDPGNVSRVLCSLRNLTEDKTGVPVTSPVVEAVVVLAEAYGDPPEMPPLTLVNEAAPKRDAAAFYNEIFFHDSLWQGVSSIESQGSNGGRTTLVVLPTEALIRGNPAPAFVIDPLTLDAASQALACWTSDQFTAGWMAFPFQVRSIELVQAPKKARELVPCNVLLTQIEENQLCANIDVGDAAGRLWMRLKNFTVRRFFLPENLTPILYQPTGFPAICEAHPELVQALSLAPALECRVLRAQFLNNASFLTRSWAMRILSRRERHEFQRAGSSHLAQAAWLSLRQTGKEAIVSLLQRYFGLNVLPADVELAQDATGRWSATGAWQSQVKAEPMLALSQQAGMTIAVATLAESTARSLSIASAGENSGLGDRKFGQEETVFIGALHPQTQQEWRLRLALARQAAGEVCFGNSTASETESVFSINAETGLVVAGPQGEGVEERRLEIATSQIANLTVAIALSESPRKIV